ncbi:MAG: recombination protein RecR [Parcubacteria group bacterium]|nr:recombination protein RecR [Parcubacteria group bacterium]
MDAIERLAALFEKFPGIGPRQAGRFVHYLLRSSPALRDELVRGIAALGKEVRQCNECRRYHDGAQALCSRCASTSRDHTLLMIVATDADADAIERSHTYNGTYFILGGTVALGNEKNPRIRENELVTCVKKRLEKLKEIILAFPANVEGDTTAERVRDLLSPLTHGIAISALGRGLSTGAELEYVDPDTIKNALTNRG